MDVIVRDFDEDAKRGETGLTLASANLLSWLAVKDFAKISL